MSLPNHLGGSSVDRQIVQVNEEDAGALELLVT